MFRGGKKLTTGDLLGTHERSRARAEITDRALGSISTFAPHLVHLTLLQCGRLDDDVLTAWSHPVTGFKELRHLTLYAPYLVRAEKWKKFFQGIGAGADEDEDGDGVVVGEKEKEKKRPELETFQLRMSSRAFSCLVFFLCPLSPESLVSLPSVASIDGLMIGLDKIAARHSPPN